VGSLGTLLIMLAGMLVVLGISVWMAFSEARSPYDEDNGAWFPLNLTFSGLGHGDGKKAVLAAFESGNIPSIAQSAIPDGNPKKGALLVGLSHVVPHGQWLLRLTHQVYEKTTKTLGDFLASKSEVDMMLKSVAQRLDPGEPNVRSGDSSSA